MGEYDRNFIPEPIPVLRPVPRPADYDPNPSWFRTLFPKQQPQTTDSNIEIEDYSKYDVPAQLGAGILRKGYKRVSVLYNPGTSPYAPDPVAHMTKGDYYDIILHNGEAYYLPLDISVPPASDGGMDSEIIDYCSGPNHSILLTKW